MMNLKSIIDKECSPRLSDINFIIPIAQQVVSQLSEKQKVQQSVGQIQAVEKANAELSRR
jgi:hypothetical protein